MNKIFLTWHHVYDHVQTIIDQMTQIQWKPHMIVGVTRGGLIPAVLLSHYFDCQMDSINISLRDHNTHNDANVHKINNWAIIGYPVLIVDDINDSGATIHTIMKTITHKQNVKIATLVNNQGSTTTVDFFGMNINKQVDPSWIVFPWEKED